MLGRERTRRGGARRLREPAVAVASDESYGTVVQAKARLDAVDRAIAEAAAEPALPTIVARLVRRRGLVQPGAAASHPLALRAPPRLRGPLHVRLALLVVGLFLFAAGIVALLESRLGLTPWDVLHQGLAKRTPLTFGSANIAVSGLVLAVAWLLGARIGIGTVANALLVGSFVELLTSVPAVDRTSDWQLGARVGLLAGGLALMGVGSAFYLGAGVGAGPRDSLMVVGAARTRFRIGVVRAALELGALAIGVVLGGRVGVGTVAFALSIGPIVEASFWLLEHSPLAVQRDAPYDEADRDQLERPGDLREHHDPDRGRGRRQQ